MRFWANSNPWLMMSSAPSASVFADGISPSNSSLLKVSAAESAWCLSPRWPSNTDTDAVIIICSETWWWNASRCAHYRRRPV